MCSISLTPTHSCTDVPLFIVMQKEPFVLFKTVTLLSSFTVTGPLFVNRLKHSSAQQDHMFYPLLVS